MTVTVSEAYASAVSGEIRAWIGRRGLVHEGIVEANPMQGIKKPPTPRPRPRPLTEAELQTALRAATPRTQAFLTLGYLAGLRASEIAKMHGADVEQSRMRVVGKGGVDETLPTHPVLWLLAQQFPRDGYWFPPRQGSAPHVSADMVTYNVGRLFRSLGLKGATHRARHTYGTHLLRGGANLRVVQDPMRHRSLATTALYLGVDEDERLNAILSLSA